MLNFLNQIINSLEVIGGDLKDVQSSSLTIQDQSGIQAIAGIIGSERSAVSSNTSNIAVEAAFLNPKLLLIKLENTVLQLMLRIVLKEA